MTPNRPGPRPLVLSLAWQGAHLANACSPWAASPAPAQLPGTTANPTAIAAIGNENRIRMIDSVCNFPWSQFAFAALASGHNGFRSPEPSTPLSGLAGYRLHWAVLLIHPVLPIHRAAGRNGHWAPLITVSGYPVGGGLRHARNRHDRHQELRQNRECQESLCEHFLPYHCNELAKVGIRDPVIVISLQLIAKASAKLSLVTLLHLCAAIVLRGSVTATYLAG